MIPFLVSTAVRTCSRLATRHIYGHSTEGAFLIDGTALHISLSQRSALIYASGRCDLALALPTTCLVETPCWLFHHYLASQWAKASERSMHTFAHTLPSSRLHRVYARGHVNLPLPPLWKDLSPRGLSCLVGQRGKRLCKRAKWGTGLAVHTRTLISILCEVRRLRKSGVYDPCLLVRIFMKRSIFQKRLMHEIHFAN